MRTNHFICLFVKNYIGTLVDSKNASNQPVVYATDRSKAVVPVLFFFCVALWFILVVRGASCLLLFVLEFFFSPFSIVITSLAGLNVSIVCLVCT